MKKIAIILLIIHAQYFNLFSQDKTYQSLDLNLIVPTYLNGSFFNSAKQSYQKVDCYSNDTLSIVLDTTFYWKNGNEEYALMVFNTLLYRFDIFQTGVIFFTKNEGELWSHSYTDMNISEISKFESPPNHKLLVFSDKSRGLLTYNDYGGKMGYNYYLCDLYSVDSKNKVFSLNSLIDSSGGREGKDCIETTKSIFTYGNDLCIKTKGHIEKYKKVNYSEFFKYNEEQSHYILYKTINHLKK